MAPVLEQASDTAWQPRSALLGTLLANRYRISQFVGQGSTGAVYRADDVISNKPVAIRILVPALAQQPALVTRIRARVERNAQVHQKDPSALINLVDIFDVGMTLEGELFVVTDFIDGDHLSTMLSRGGRLPWSRARHLFIRLCQLLHGFHQHGIVLGTLQARHCYAVRGRPKSEAIKIVNTAIFEHLSAAITPGSGAAGAAMARYIAPEQACGEPIDARTDVYSFGVIAYELLTGRVPFFDSNGMRVVSMHLQTPPQPLRQLAPEAEIPQAVEDVVLRALAKSPNDRFQSMDAFAAALSAIPEGAGTTASFPTLPPPLAAVPPLAALASAPAAAAAAPASAATLAPPPGVGGPVRVPPEPLAARLDPPQTATPSPTSAAPEHEPLAPGNKVAPSVVMRPVAEPAPTPAPAPVAATPLISPPPRPPSAPAPAAVILQGLAAGAGPKTPVPATSNDSGTAVALGVGAVAAASAAAEAAASESAAASSMSAAPAASSMSAAPAATSMSAAPAATSMSAAPAATSMSAAPAATSMSAATSSPAAEHPASASMSAGRAELSASQMIAETSQVGAAVSHAAATSAPAASVSAAHLSVVPPQAAEEVRAAVSGVRPIAERSPEVSPDDLRDAVIRQSHAGTHPSLTQSQTGQHPSLSQVSGYSDSIVAQLPRQRTPWAAFAGGVAAVAIAAIVWVQMQKPAETTPAAAPPPTKLAKVEPPPKPVEEIPSKPAEPERGVGVQPPLPVDPPPPETKVAPLVPETPPPADDKSGKTTEKKKTGTKKKRVVEAEPEEEDVLDQVRKHMLAKQAAEEARKAALNNPPGTPSPTPTTTTTPTPQPKPPDAAAEADKGKETLERARQAASNGNHPLAYSLAKQAYSQGKNVEALELMGTSACKAGNADGARSAANQLSGARKSAVVDACSKAGITL